MVTELKIVGAIALVLATPMVVAVCAGPPPGQPPAAHMP
jgi:hypothetical protein